MHDPFHHNPLKPFSLNALDEKGAVWWLYGPDPPARDSGMPYSWDHGEVTRDLAFLEGFSWHRAAFSDRICEASQDKSPKVLAGLRMESTYQLAEFLYSLKAYGVESEASIDRFVELHNNYIVDLTKDKEKMERLGLTMERALAGIFTADTKPRLLQNWKARPGAIDQSNLARFLVAVMSTETCRKVVVDCSAAGLLVRERTPYGTVLVISTGKIEDIFGSCLRDLRRSIRNMGAPS
jgi:hypothetical protein